MERFDWLFDQWQWWRRRRGGHWEQWWVEGGVNASIWHYTGPSFGDCSRVTRQRPTGICRGTPRCEDW